MSYVITECDLTENGREVLGEEEFPEANVEFQVNSLLTYIQTLSLHTF